MISRVSSLVDEAALVKTKSVNYMFRFANNEVTVSKQWATQHVTLYVAKGRRALSLSTSGDLEWGEVERALSRLGSIPEDPLYVPLSCTPPSAARESVEDFERLLDLVKAAVDSAEGVERNAGVAVLSYTTAEYEDSYGRSGSYALNRVYLVVRSFVGDLSATAASAGRSVKQIDGRSVGLLNSQLLQAARGLPVRRTEPGRRHLLLSPLVWGSLMGEFVSVWASGTEVLSNSSRFTPGDIGGQVASAALTLEEGAWRRENFGYLPFDKEGCETRRVEILKRGVLGGFIHTLRSARYMGAEPTGHAVEAYYAASPSHVDVAPGDGPSDIEDLFRELGEGYYIHGNWYTRYQNVKLGQFSTVGRDVAFEVKDGRPVAVVKFIRIADTLDNLVRNVEILSRRTWQIYWWDMRAAATSPFAIVRGVGVST